MQQLQNAVETEIRIIKVFPDQNHNDARHQHRDDEQRLDDAGELFMPDMIQNQRGQQREEDAVEHGKQAQKRLIPERHAEHIVREQSLVVFQPDEMRFASRHPVGQRGIERQTN